jgi:D-alanyl-lipoteichoic acid acyltransferase DltB (MBOAT superfamily)
MAFNSFQFLYFLIACFVVFHGLPERFRSPFLLLASYYFYGSWEVLFLILIFSSTVLDYFCGKRIGNSKNENIRKLFLGLSLTGNLGLLFVFKYFDFFSVSFAKLFAMSGNSYSPLILDLILPVGISFYTFQTLSYTIDIYRKEIKPINNFFQFALFVSYFPQLVAGPIERAKDLLPQLEKLSGVTADKFKGGIWLILLGLFKKVVIADNLSRIVEPAFDSPGVGGGFQMLLALYAFTFQVYGDFSGYSDIARGTSKLFGIELRLNFQIPFFAKNIQIFWNRWHMSLSSWLKDYVFFPLMLRGPLRDKAKSSLFVSMVLIGIWHGAAWKYAVFGLYHGTLLIVFESTRKIRKKIRNAGGGFQKKCWSLFCIVLTYHLAAVGGLAIFGCKWLARLKQMGETVIYDFSFHEKGFIMLGQMIYYVGPLLLLHLYKEKYGQDCYKEWSWSTQLLVMWYLLLMILFHGTVEGGYFIYFQF